MPARRCTAISPSVAGIENFAWCTVTGSVTGPSTSIAPWCTCAVDCARCRSGREVVGLRHLEQRVGGRMGVAAGGVELERRFEQRPARAEAVDEPCRIGVGGHAGRHALLALEDALRAGEAVPGEEGGGQPVGGGLGGVELLGIGGVAQELPQPRGLRAGRADRMEHRRRRRGRAGVPTATAAAIVPAVPVVWKTR